MKALVVYDSVFGNTEKVALAISQALLTKADVSTQRISESTTSDFTGVNLLIVGSPTRGFNPTPAISKWLRSLVPGSLKGISVAAFDTRIDSEEVGSKILTGMVKVFGYAAKPIAGKLAKKGGDLKLEPEGFIVTGTEGPLREGELERAAEWAQQLTD
ncbi:MAG: nitric oxide synthase [Anaerolineae bacterium]|nr:nitric oxide synthase [Anaerolineae bacterium]